MWAYVGLTLFALGAVTLVISVIWQTRSGRVTIGYLLGSRHIPTKVRTFLNENAYLLGGQSNLNAFRDRLTELVQKPRPLGDSDSAELRRLLAARDAILGTGSSERARIVSFWAGPLVLIGALAATLGAATFALATNHDLVLRQDRLAKEERARQTLPAGELLPKTPSSILLVVPSKNSDRMNLQNLLGPECELSGVMAILLDVGLAPLGGQAYGPKPQAFRVVTERSPKCTIASFWVPMSWVVPRPAESTPPSATGSAAPAAASGTGTGTTTTGTTTTPSP